MGEAYTKLSALVQTIRQTISDSGTGQIQKIFSSRSQICLAMRFRGQTKYLLIGRGGTSCGAGFVEKNIESSQRLKDRFLDLLRNWLVGRRIHEVRVFHHGLGIQLKFNGEIQEASFFVLWAKGKLHFALTRTENSEFPAQTIIPWFNSQILKSHLAMSDSQIIALYEEKIKLNEIQFNVIDLEAGEDSSTRKSLRRKSKFIKRKQERIADDLCRVNKLIEIQNTLLNIEPSMLEDRYFTFDQYKLKLPQGLNFYQKRDYIFKKIKDYKVARKILETRLSDAHDKINREVISDNPHSSNQKAFMPEWVQDKNTSLKKVSAEIPDTVTEYVLSDGSVIRHGKDARANEWLRSKWSNKEDYWFHLSDRSSGHAYLRARNQSLSEELLSAIGSMLADQDSSFPSKEAHLVYTLAKNLKGIKGQVGGVIMKKTKQITIICKSDWKEIIAKL